MKDSNELFSLLGIKEHTNLGIYTISRDSGCENQFHIINSDKRVTIYLTKETEDNVFFQFVITYEKVNENSIRQKQLIIDEKTIDLRREKLDCLDYVKLIINSKCFDKDRIVFKSFTKDKRDLFKKR